LLAGRSGTHLLLRWGQLQQASRGCLPGRALRHQLLELRDALQGEPHVCRHGQQLTHVGGRWAEAAGQARQQVRHLRRGGVGWGGRGLCLRRGLAGAQRAVVTMVFRVFRV
jgi:hypothetical protein